MRKMIQNLLTILTLLVAVTAAPAMVYAQPAPLEGEKRPSAPAVKRPPAPVVSDSKAKDEACAALAKLDSTKNCRTGGETAVGKLVSSIVKVLSVVVGIAAVIMIIVSGFKYVTSGGDSGSIASAKTTLIYALVGLAIAALAQVLVRFVLNTVK